MTFKEFVGMCDKLLKKNPECAEYKCLHGIDDTEDGFLEIVYEGVMLGHYDTEDGFDSAHWDKDNAVYIE